MLSRLASIFVVLCGFVTSMAAIHAAQQNSEAKVPAPAAPAASTSGAELYARRCNACHGNDLKGNGPFPPPYRTPPDLTTLARRHGGKFPDAYVSNVLRNGVKLAAHGPAEMPVWGTDLGAPDQSDKAQVKLRIKSLTSYIKSMQVN
jgi:mono/diheme cytochrome c family protein